MRVICSFKKTIICAIEWTNDDNAIKTNNDVNFKVLEYDLRKQ